MPEGVAIPPKRKLVADLLRLCTALAEGRREPEQVAQDLTKLATFAAGLAPASKRPGVPAEDTKAKEDEVFIYWRQAANKPKATFTPQRRAKVRARLREKRTVEDIKRAIDFVCHSPWHTGENPEGKTYLDLELICRDATKFEKYLEQAEETQSAFSRPVVGAPNETEKSEALSRAIEDSKDALARGDQVGYSKAQAKIRELRR